LIDDDEDDVKTTPTYTLKDIPFELRNKINNLLYEENLQHAQLIKLFLSDDIICVNKSKQRFYLWNKKTKIWDEDKKGCSVKVKISEFLVKLFNMVEADIIERMEEGEDKQDLLKSLDKKRKKVSSHSTMMDIMKTYCSLGYKDNWEKNLNKNRSLLSLKNGVIDLKTGKMRERTKSDMISYRLDREYKETDLTNLGNLGHFLNESFKDKGKEKDKLIEFIQKFLGYCMTGEVKEQMFCVWLGTRGGNGKSLLCSLMASVLGSLYTNLSVSDLCKGNKCDSEKKLFGKLLDKRIAVIEEPDKKDRIKESVIKSMCGLTDETPVNTKQLYKDEMDRLMFFSLVLNTNYFENCDSTDDAFWRRVYVVPFDRYFRSVDDKDYDENDELCGIRDDDLLTKIQKEDLFFYWVVEGARKYYKEGLKNTPMCMRVAKENARSDNDDIGNFLDDFTEYNTNTKKYVSKKELHERYEIEVGKLDIKIFGSMMKKRGHKEMKIRRIVGMEKKRITVWKNLKLKVESECLITDN